MVFLGLRFSAHIPIDFLIGVAVTESPNSFEIRVHEGDVLGFECDVLLLKYSQHRYGVDGKVANVLLEHELCTENQISPRPGEHALVDTRGHIGPDWILFLGTPRLYEFDYNQMSRFARDSLNASSLSRVSVRQLATTVHGANYGLDAIESLQHIVAGFEAARDTGVTPQLERITFVEIDPRRARMLASFVNSDTPVAKTGFGVGEFSPTEPPASGRTETPTPSRRPRWEEQRQEREHIFVAIPFSAEFEDVYEFGIYGPVRDCGYICEHVGQAAFTGDVLERIRDRIADARLVIADLSNARPNVYLEVGFAWGRGIPVVILAREGEKLHFDVSTHKCIYYRNITHLAKELRQLLGALAKRTERSQ